MCGKGVGEWRGEVGLAFVAAGRVRRSSMIYRLRAIKSRDDSDITEKRLPLNWCLGSPSGLRPPVRTSDSESAVGWLTVFLFYHRRRKMEVADNHRIIEYRLCDFT